MITLLTGGNDYEIEHELQARVAEYPGIAEIADGSVISAGRLVDLISGATLFSDKRLVVIRNMSENTAVWQAFVMMTDRVSDDVQLLLVEPKLDKRTASYKALKKLADIREFKEWTERDISKVENWLAAEATRRDMVIDKKCLRHIVGRVGADQWRLIRALDKLSLLDEVTLEIIDDIIEPSPSESVWGLFEMALRGNGQNVQAMLETLRLSQDPYMLLGLLGGQVYQLAVMSMASSSTDQVAKDLGLKSAFPLTKLAPFASKLSPSQVKRIVEAFAEADVASKTTAGEPWLLVERALLKVTQVVN